MAETIEIDGQQVPIERVAPSAYMGEDRRDIQRLSKSESGREAAAVATANIMADFLGNPSSPRVAENAGNALEEIRADLIAGQADGQPPAASPVTRTDSGLHVVQQPEEVAAMPTEYELPPELAYLNDPDETADDEDDLDPAAVAVTPDPDPATVELDDDDLADPRIAALVAERDKLAKQAAHERSVRVKTTRPTWEQEAKSVFRLGDVPLLDDTDLASIKADSKRDFLRKAKTIADNNKRVMVRLAPTAAAAPAPAPAPPLAERAAQWGDPPAGAPPSDVQRNDNERRLAAARRTGRLDKIFGEMIRGS